MPRGKNTSSTEFWDRLSGPGLDLIAHALAILLPLLGVGVALALLVADFQDGLQQGVRGFAALLLPVLVASYLYRTDPAWMRGLDQVSHKVLAVVSFVVSLGLLLAAMLWLSDGPFPEIAISLGLSAMLLARQRVSNEASIHLMYGTAFALIVVALVFGTGSGR